MRWITGRSSPLYSGLLALVSGLSLVMPATLEAMPQADKAITSQADTRIVQLFPIKPAVVYDAGGKHDQSFNQAVYQNAVTRFKREFGGTVREFEPSTNAQIEQGLTKLARRGYQPIITVGYSMAAPVAKVAQQFPQVKFTVIDGIVELPNVQSILFKEQEGSFLVGALAAMMSKTQKIGFVGGSDVPLVRKFSCGYVQGARYTSQDITIYKNMTGSTVTAWSDPTKGSELAKSQISKGADVIYAAAGGTGLGVYQAARDEGIMAVGVDSNQNHLHPGTMLTSMVKRVGVAAYDSFMAVRTGQWQPGIRVLGLEEDGVALALDDYNRHLLPADVIARLASLREDIIVGKIKVHDYMSDSHCPM